MKNLVTNNNANASGRPQELALQTACNHAIGRLLIHFGESPMEE